MQFCLITGNRIGQPVRSGYGCPIHSGVTKLKEMSIKDKKYDNFQIKIVVDIEKIKKECEDLDFHTATEMIKNEFNWLEKSGIFLSEIKRIK